MPRSLTAGGLFPPPRSARRPRTQRGGFTLFEMAICIAILGLMSGLMLQYMSVSNQKKCERNTAHELAEMQNALDQFVAANNRYPLPASRNVSAHEPTYGTEVSSSVDPAIHRVGGARPVLIGAVPHSSLGLASQLEGDCWGNKFTYAVTESMTTSAGYANTANLGGITLRYGSLSQWVPLEEEAAYALISHGANALGASSTAYSGPAKQCNAEALTASLTRIDKENCDTLNATFYLADQNDQEGASFFDDTIVVANRPVEMAPPGSCAAGNISWGSGCSGDVLLTLLGIAVNVTNTAPGYTGLAVSTCNNGVRNTVGVCLPVGACVYNSPRNGQPTSLLTITSMNYGTGVCKTYKCCNGTVTSSPLSPCLAPLDLPGLLPSCP